MTKFRFYSDLHLDWYFTHGMPFNPVTGEMKVWKPPVLPDDKDTILVLGGDIWTGSHFIEFAGYSWIGEVAPRFKQVLIVLGNHDYWPVGRGKELTIIKGGEKLNAMLQDYGVHNVKVLDSDTFEIDDILVVGATLWTDIGNREPLAMATMHNTMHYDGKIAYETGPNGHWVRFTAEHWVRTHERQRNYIKMIAENNRNKRIVVVTHHLPLTGLIDPRYNGQMSNVYYYSDLSNIILDNENIIAWMCGHSHRNVQVQFPEWSGEDGCKCIMNAVGYTSEHREQEEMVSHEVIEL